MKDRVVYVGDIHGDFTRLLRGIKGLAFSNVIFICVGDVGIGFHEKHLEIKRLLAFNDLLRRRNCQFWAIRGNHDNPDWWKTEYRLSNLRLIPDYTVDKINGKKYLFVGGGISIDREKREINRTYWSDEGILPCPDELEEVDILVSHSCPSYFNVETSGLKKHFGFYVDRDKTLMDDCFQERAVLDEIVAKANPKEIFYGHFHNSTYEVGHTGIRARCIDILEFYEAYQPPSFSS